MNTIMKMEVEILRCGQPRPYADSEYEYILTTEHMPEYQVKAYCTEVLFPKKRTFGEWDEKRNDSADVYFGGYYTFEKLDQNKYRYFVLEPFCD